MNEPERPGRPKRRKVLKQISGAAVGLTALTSGVGAAEESNSAEWGPDVEAVRERIETELMPRFDDYFHAEGSEILNKVASSDAVPVIDEPSLDAFGDVTKFLTHKKRENGAVAVLFGVRTTVEGTAVQIRVELDGDGDVAIVEPSDSTGTSSILTSDEVRTQNDPCMLAPGCEASYECSSGEPCRWYCRSGEYDCCDCYFKQDGGLCGCSCGNCSTTCSDQCS